MDRLLLAKRLVGLAKEVLGTGERTPKGYTRFKLWLGDKKQELLMALLDKKGYKGKPDKRHVEAFVYLVPTGQAKSFPGLWAHRESADWQGFGSGQVEGIEYRIVRKGKGPRGLASRVDYKGTFTVYGGYGGETTVPVKGRIMDLKMLDPDSIEQAVYDDVQWYLDENPELYSEEDEGYPG